MQYRRLTTDELQEMTTEFVHFLATNQVTAPEWEQLKRDGSPRVEELIEQFSELVFERILQKVEYLEHRAPKDLRTYHCLPGKLPALLDRFANITLAIWERHGIRQAGFWTTVIGESNNDLVYLLQWDSLADREKKWNAFMADPEWQQKRAQTEADGPILASLSSQILQPTAFSSVK